MTGPNVSIFRVTYVMYPQFVRSLLYIPLVRIESCHTVQGPGYRGAPGPHDTGGLWYRGAPGPTFLGHYTFNKEYNNVGPPHFQ